LWNDPGGLVNGRKASAFVTTDEIPLSVFFNIRGDIMSPEFSVLREKRPVARMITNTGDSAWYVTSYSLAAAVFQDPRFSLSRTALGGTSERDDVPFPPITVSVMKALTAAGLRGEFMRHVGPQQTAAPPRWIRQVASEAVEAMTREGHRADLVRDFALPVTLAVACRLLGFPQGDRHLLAEAVDMDVDFGAYEPAERAASWERLRRHVHERFCGGTGREESRHQAGSGLIGGLFAANRHARQREADGHASPGITPLSDTDLIDIGCMLVIGTVANPAAFLAIGGLALARHPRARRRLARDPEAMPGAVEELLRYSIMVGGGLPRVATEDVRLGEVTVRAGELVLLATDAAHRDPEAYPEPDEFDIDRPPSCPHLRFGGGRHYCPASRFSRMVAENAFGALLERLPELRLALALEELEWLPDRHVLLPRRLPVRW
jgi:mycocyclosin synthase